MKQIIALTLLIPFYLINSHATTQQMLCNGKEIVGSIEKIILAEQHVTMDAKIDTGAAMSSLSATNIKIYKKNNQQWISFTVNTQKNSQMIHYDKPILKYINILKREDESNLQVTNKLYSSRPVVVFTICVGNKKLTTNINLVDRTKFKYPMLIGNKTLQQYQFVVDPEQKYMMKTTCN